MNGLYADTRSLVSIKMNGLYVILTLWLCLLSCIQEAHSTNTVCDGVTCTDGNPCVGTATPAQFCEIMPCANTTSCSSHGACTPGTGGNISRNYCACSPGFSGPACATVECSPACQNGRVCIVTPTGNQCDCGSTFGGAQCQFAACGVVPVTCIDAKPCVVGAATAEFCEINCTDASACNSHGVCTAGTVDSTKKYCACSPGYSGPACATPPVCSPLCLQGGTCVYHATGKNTCSCITGFTGTACEFAVCNGDTCTNAEPCINVTTVLHCSISPCAAATACSSHGACTAAAGKNYCACTAGYNGAICATKMTTAAPAKTTPGSAGHRISASLGVLLVTAAYFWVQ